MGIWAVWSMFSPQVLAQHWADWVGTQHLLIRSVIQCLLNDEWLWLLSGRRENKKWKLSSVKDLWNNTEGLGVSPAWDSLRIEKCLRGDLSHSIFPHLWTHSFGMLGLSYSLILWNRAIPFPGLKTSQSSPVRGTDQSSHLITSSSALRREDTLKGLLLTVASFLVRNCRYYQRGLDGEKNGALNSLWHKKIKWTNQHYLPSVPDRADVK